MWMKYRHKWNHGIAEDFEWKELTRRDDCTLKEAEDLAQSFISENFCGELYDWYGAWRGVEHEIISYPPKEVVEKLIVESARLTGYYKESMDYYVKLHKTIANTV